MKHITVFRDEGFYPSHASSCVAANGDILTVFRQAPFEHIFAHVHPQSRIDMVRSTDMGETWDPSTRTVVYDPGDGINLNDPSITTLSDGTLIATAFLSYAPWKNTGDWGDKIIAVRGTDFFYVGSERWIVVLRSFDDGFTWDGPYTMDCRPYTSRDAAVFASVLELSDGRLLMPVSSNDHDECMQKAVVMCSEDQGKTWEPYSQITAWRGEDGSLHFGLPSIVSYDDQNLLAAGWSNAEIGTALSTSSDGGKTWGPVQKVVSKGECSHLCKMRNGTTILSYGYRRPPFGIRVWPSYDQGKTWNAGDAAALRSDGAMRDLGYPRTIELPNGSLFCVYYFNMHETDKSYYDKEKSLQVCNTWKLNPPLYTYQVAGLRFIGATIFTEDELKELAGTATLEPQLCEAGPTLL